ncbi:MAG: endonuclease MutS2 [Desulfonauticus sp.]|nr:endonuclease MutS2 [Desulfonauticus sp.]
MHSKTIKYLELDKVLRFFSSEATSEEGKAYFLSLRPDLDFWDVLYAQKLLESFFQAVKYKPLSVDFFPSLKGVFKNLVRENYVFDLEDVWGLEVFFRSQEKIFDWLEQVTIFFKDIEDFEQKKVCPFRLKQAIFRCVGENGELKDESSPALLEVRQAIYNIQKRCTKKIEEFFQQNKISHYLQDEFLTISSDRYVIPLKANFKGKIDGIIHDYSQTGETCYLEPFFLIELNNQLQQLKLEEKIQERAVLEYLTNLARQEQSDLVKCYNFVVQIDVYLAKVKAGLKIGAVPLAFNEQGRLSLKEVRHPLLAFLGQKVVPVDIELKSEQKGLIITGGNAGGKTVCLKTLGLTALMVACGLPVCCAKNSQLPYFKQVFAIMGDEQNLEESLSTFTAQIELLKTYLQNLDQHTLVILDEFGTGTDPTQGAALAQAVVEYILEQGAWVVCATHFPGLKVYGLTSNDLRVCSVLFDPETKRPLYKLLYDQVGASFAFQVAKAKGLPEVILEKAEKILGTQGEKETLLLERLNSLVWKKEQELSDFRVKKDKIVTRLKDALTQIRHRYKTLEQEVQRAKQKILQEWKEQKISRKKAIETLSKLQSELKQEKKTTKQDFSLAVGDKCLYVPWDKQAKVIGFDAKKQQYKLDLGGIIVWTQKTDLAPWHKIREPKNGQVVVQVEGQSLWRLDVRGFRVDEALIEVDKYLDRAVLKSRKIVEIVHGKGAGILKQAIHNSLRNHPLVAQFYLAPLEQGGDGVTLVELK